MSVTAVETTQAILNHSHRCDRCGSRAYVLLVLHWSPGLPHAGELLMCAHHYAQHAEAVEPYLSIVIDERWQLAKHIEDDKHVN